MTFSAVVLSYRRVHNLERIVARLLEQPFVDDIVIAHNDGAAPLSSDVLGKAFDPLGVSIWNCSENCYTASRYETTPACRHDWILTCDDDYLVGNWPLIAETFAADPTCITAAMTVGHENIARQKYTWGDAQEVLPGWGSAFDRRWIGPTFAPYLARYNRDTLFLRKADRLFSLLLRRHHNIIRWQGVNLMNDALDEPALCQLGDHGTLNDEARKRARELMGL